MWQRIGFFKDERTDPYRILFENPFKILIKTDNTGGTADNQYEMPVRGAWDGTGTFEGDVTYIDWGDGIIERHITGFDATSYPTHTYSSPGEYLIRFTVLRFASNSLDGIVFTANRNNDDSDKLLKVVNWGDVTFYTGSEMFEDCTNVDVIAKDAPVFVVSGISSMFQNCSSLQGSVYFNSWSDQWESVDSAFEGATSFNADLDQWDMSAITSLKDMFYGATSFNGNVSTWDTANVTTMERTFRDASSFNSDIGSWDTSSCNLFSSTFRDASSFNSNIGSWSIKTVGIGNAESMFRGASAFNQDIGSWSTNALQYNMGNMFNGCTVFNQDLSGWCVNLLPGPPTNFDLNCTAWTASRPVWGTCP